MSEQRVPQRSVRRAAGSPPAIGRHVAKHRVAKRGGPGNAQLVGLAAALAAAAGGIAGGHHLLSTKSANAAVDIAALSATRGDLNLSGLATARIQRRELATRDTSRGKLPQAQAGTKQADADRIARARAAKLDGSQQLVARRAAALAATKAKAKAQAEAEIRAEARLAAAITMPLSGYRITAVFGQGGDRWARNHTGTDFAAPTGTRIGALMRGEVISAGPAGPYGNQVKIRHDDGTETWYNHMSKITVSVGDTVTAGQKVGAVGSTGNSTGPHLHLEIRPGGGAPVDPIRWLRGHGLNP